MAVPAPHPCHVGVYIPRTSDCRGWGKSRCPHGVRNAPPARAAGSLQRPEGVKE